MIYIHILGTSNLLLVDTSYYVFHRYNATLKWYTFSLKPPANQNVEPGDENHGSASDVHESPATQGIDHSSLHEDVNFVNAFKRHFEKDIAKWRKQWKLAVASNIIFVTDCPRAQIWRNDIYPEYKAHRVQATSFNPGIFHIFYTMLDEMCSAGRCCLMSGSRLEADDVVYLTTKLLKAKGFAKDIVILTNDNDYLQMRDIGDNIHMFNMMNVDLTTRSVGSPGIDLLVKIMMGDVSDNIPPMCSKMGKKTALKLACLSQDERESFIVKKGIACVEQFAKNERLVSLKCIPMDLAQMCTGLYNIQIT